MQLRWVQTFDGFLLRVVSLALCIYQLKYNIQYFVSVDSHADLGTSLASHRPIVLLQTVSSSSNHSSVCSESSQDANASKSFKNKCQLSEQQQQQILKLMSMVWELLEVYEILNLEFCGISNSEFCGISSSEFYASDSVICLNLSIDWSLSYRFWLSNTNAPLVIIFSRKPSSSTFLSSCKPFVTTRYGQCFIFSDIIFYIF